MTEDGLGVKIVLNRDEDEANHDDECGHLIIKYFYQSLLNPPYPILPHSRYIAACLCLHSGQFHRTSIISIYLVVKSEQWTVYH